MVKKKKNNKNKNNTNTGKKKNSTWSIPFLYLQNPPRTISRDRFSTSSSVSPLWGCLSELAASEANVVGRLGMFVENLWESSTGFWTFKWVFSLVEESVTVPVFFKNTRGMCYQGRSLAVGVTVHARRGFLEDFFLARGSTSGRALR